MKKALSLVLALVFAVVLTACGNAGSQEQPESSVAGDWQGKTVIPFQTHGGWPGHVIKDMKSVCKGAVFSHEMEIQFDSTGGSELVTSEQRIEAWIEQIKGGK